MSNSTKKYLKEYQEFQQTNIENNEFDLSNPDFIDISSIWKMDEIFESLLHVVSKCERKVDNIGDAICYSFPLKEKDEIEYFSTIELLKFQRHPLRKVFRLPGNFGLDECFFQIIRENVPRHQSSKWKEITIPEPPSCLKNEVVKTFGEEYDRVKYYWLPEEGRIDIRFYRKISNNQNDLNEIQIVAFNFEKQVVSNRNGKYWHHPKRHLNLPFGCQNVPNV